MKFGQLQHHPNACDATLTCAIIMVNLHYNGIMMHERLTYMFKTLVGGAIGVENDDSPSGLIAATLYS